MPRPAAACRVSRRPRAAPVAGPPAGPGRARCHRRPARRWPRPPVRRRQGRRRPRRRWCARPMTLRPRNGRCDDHRGPELVHLVAGDGRLARVDLELVQQLGRARAGCPAPCCRSERTPSSPLRACSPATSAQTPASASSRTTHAHAEEDRPATKCGSRLSRRAQRAGHRQVTSRGRGRHGSRSTVSAGGSGCGRPARRRRPRPARGRPGARCSGCPGGRTSRTAGSTLGRQSPVWVARSIACQRASTLRSNETELGLLGGVAQHRPVAQVEQPQLARHHAAGAPEHQRVELHLEQRLGLERLARAPGRSCSRRPGSGRPGASSMRST